MSAQFDLTCEWENKARDSGSQSWRAADGTSGNLPTALVCFLSTYLDCEALSLFLPRHFRVTLFDSLLIPAAGRRVLGLPRQALGRTKSVSFKACND